MIRRILNWIGNFCEAVFDTCHKYTKLTIITILVSFGIVVGCWKIWVYNMDKIKADIPSAAAPEELIVIHHNISNATDVTNRVPPLRMLATIDSVLSVNAFTTGQGIYFTYAADAVLNTDEKALIMGHEIAHVILHHTDAEYDMLVNNTHNEDELMADNLGAVWADKAGYDVCAGREVFKKFYQWGGNSLNAVHPPNMYRYDNLAHYCK